MTRLALCALVWSPCAVLFADEPKQPPPALEGAWQEPAMPGEDPSMRYKIVFAGEKATIHYREQVLTGTATVAPEFDQMLIIIGITHVEGSGPHVKGTYLGVYEEEKGRLSLRFDHPLVSTTTLRQYPGVDGGSRIVVLEDLRREQNLGLAPVTLTLHKVAK